MRKTKQKESSQSDPSSHKANARSGDFDWLTLSSPDGESGELSNVEDKTYNGRFIYLNKSRRDEILVARGENPG